MQKLEKLRDRIIQRVDVNLRHFDFMSRVSSNTTFL